jgi:type IV pilus assembly protein PilW
MAFLHRNQGMRANQAGAFPQIKGFTLVELLTALVIGSILMLGAITIMVNSKDAYETQDDLARLQENARFAMNMLLKDIRMAGYFGCGAGNGDTFDHIDNGGAGNLFDSENGIEGMDNYAGGATWQPSGAVADIDAVAGVTYFPDSDGLTVRYLDPSTVINVVAKMPNSSANIEVSSNGTLLEGQIIGITDCANTDVLQVTSLPGTTKIQTNSGSGSPGNVDAQTFGFAGCGTPNCLSKQYGDDAQVMALKAVRYFLQDDDGDGRPSLHRMIITPSGSDSTLTSQKLVDGVDSLQITYGRDTTGDGVADTYTTSANIGAAGNWDNVSTVRIGMLLNTVDEYGQTTDDVDRTVNGEAFNAVGDRRRRRLFTTTVLLRNPQ